jgi:hypothetical protein
MKATMKATMKAADEARAKVQERTIKHDARYTVGDQIKLNMEFGSIKVQQQPVLATLIKDATAKRGVVWRVDGPDGPWLHAHNKCMDNDKLEGG